ncbi:MAG: thiol reductant ABC exporter subunit CydD [Gorillibacterium sp.]|nr:thiol reductant ABC exporter subunit CydD [Gorillibacterium sp.]
MGKGLMNYKGIRLVMMMLAVLAIGQTVTIILQAKWLAEIISALFAGEPLREQYGKSLLFLLVFIARHAIWMLQQKIAYQFAEKTASDQRRKLLDRLFKLGPHFAKQQGTGSMVTLALEGVSQFRLYLELFLPRMMSMAFTPGLVLLYVFTRDVRSGIILTLTMPILIGFLILVGMAARTHTNKQLASYRTLSNHFVDSLRGLETLKVLGRSVAHTKSIERVSERYRSATVRTLRLAFLSSFSLDFFTMLSIASVAVNLGLRLVNGEMILVTALTVLILAPEYFLPVRMVGADFHATMNGKEAGETIQAVLKQPDPTDESSAEGRETNQAVGKQLDYADESSVEGTETIQAVAEQPDFAKVSSVAQGANAVSSLVYAKSSDETHGIELAPMVSGRNTLSVSDLRVQHEEAGEASLNEVTFELTGNLKIGIIGESGAGKSTLIDVLGGFLAPTAGQVKWNGSSVQLTSEAWRSQITYVPQQPYLFNCSLADNIRFYRPLASTEEVEVAIAAAGLSDLVASLPNGLAEILGSGGGRALSGGQEQRVALARAFLSKSPVLLLDEPTAHLDIETEYELKATMLPLFEDRLVFLATHRLHWMTDMDEILVLAQGKVVETGTHEQLMALGGVYYDLAMAHGEGSV